MKKILAQTPVQISQGIALLLVEKIQVSRLTYSEQFTLLDGIKHSLEPKVIETLIRKLANEGADKALYAVLSYARKNNLEFDINSKSSALKTAYDLAKEKEHLSVIGVLTCFGVATSSGEEYGLSTTSVARYPRLLTVYQELSAIPFTKIILIGPGLLWLSRPSDCVVPKGCIVPISARVFSQSTLNEFEKVKNPKDEVVTWSDVLPFYFSIFPKATVVAVDRPELIDIARRSMMLSHSDMREDMLNLFLHALLDESPVDVMSPFILWHKENQDFTRSAVSTFAKDLYENLIEFTPELPQSFAALPVASKDCSLIMALNVLQYPALRCRYESENRQYDLDKILLSLFKSMGNSGRDVLIVTNDSLSLYMDTPGLLHSLAISGIISLEGVPDGSKDNFEKLVILKLCSPDACSRIFSEFFNLYPNQTRRK